VTVHFGALESPIMLSPSILRKPTCAGMVSDFLMASEKPALVLLHGGAASGRAWQDEVPLVSRYHSVYAPTAPGHRGGPPVSRRPVTATDLVDWAERYLDEQELQRLHLVGSGIMALTRPSDHALRCTWARSIRWAATWESPTRKSRSRTSRPRYARA
jgi:pimeloyl-ACP methyl ester carboxylesterase